METRWKAQDTGDPVHAAAAIALVRDRLETGHHETWFESDSGQLLAVVTNGERAMVMLLQEVGDAGEHAIDTSVGVSMSGGYALENGQVDTYADRDNVPLTLAMDHVADIIAGRRLKPDGRCLDR